VVPAAVESAQLAQATESTLRAVESLVVAGVSVLLLQATKARAANKTIIIFFIILLLGFNYTINI
jgi:hypothetical protein